MFLYGCGEKKDIEGFKYVSLNEIVSSTSAEYSYNNKKIYVEGSLSGFDIITVEDIQYVAAKIKEGDNNWIISLGQFGTCSDENLSQYVGEKVRCFGKFIGKTDDGYLIELNQDDKYMIQKGSKTICDSQSLKPSIKYIDEYYDNNAPDVNLESYDSKVVGVYRCDGMVDDNSGESITLYQEDGDYYSKSTVEFKNGDSCVIPISDISKFKNGDGIRIYFVIDKNKQQNIIYYRKIPLFWDDDLTAVKEKNDKIENASSSQVFEKEYPWGEDGSIKYYVLYNEIENKYQYRIDVLAKDMDGLTAAATWYILRFSETDREHSLTIKVKGRKESVMLVDAGTVKNLLWTDSAGNVLTEQPNWFNLSEPSEGSALAIGDVIDIDSKFEEDYGYDFK